MRNVISGNDETGVNIAGVSLPSGAEATENRVEGNYVGTAADGTAHLGNTQNGVAISGGTNLTTVGGIAGGAGNFIAHNGEDGVSIPDSDPARRATTSSPTPFSPTAGSA
jgi:hypothetical protein